VSRAVTTEVVEEDAVGDATTVEVLDRVAHLLGAPDYGEPAPAVSHHLRHERQGVQGAMLVESGEDLRGAAHLHDVATADLVRSHADGSGSQSKHH
jgi:hypothetical protein